MSDQAQRRIKIACPGCGQKLDMTGLPPFSRINCPACNSPLTVPKWFGSYLLESLEGTGGMAVVYRALDITLDRDVAIKVFDPRLAGKGVSPDLFLHEARIAATVNHPAVVPIYSCGELDGSAYIVMQHMAGGTLDNRLRKANGRLPMMETCRWIRDVCEGLDAARELGIVHHDVKPANLLLDLDSNAKISDFGLAQAVSGKSAASAFLDSSKMWLSPHYVSPEKVLTGEEGPEGDVYSLGASFYHLLTGQPPFQSDDVQELVNMRTTRDPVSPDLVRPDITSALASVILDMMKRDPAARPTYARIAARIDDAVRAIMRPAATVPDAVPSSPDQTEKPKNARKVLSVPADRMGKPRRPSRSSHLSLLLILFFLMCGLCFLVFLPQFVGKRALLDAAPALKAVYGDLPPEIFPFLTENFYESPLIDAELAFSDSDQPLETRCTAAWVAGMYRLLDDMPSAASFAADMGEQLRSDAAIAGTRLPPADACCLAILSRPDMDPPDVYFSPEQQVRVLLGRLIRSLYDLDSDSLENGRIPNRVLARFGEVRKAFRTLPENSWLVKLYGPRLRDWESMLSGDAVPSANLEPLFLRLRSGSKKGGRQNNNLPSSGSTFSGSPFGVESPILPSGD